MIKSFLKFKIALFLFLLGISVFGIFNFIKDNEIWRAENAKAATSCKGPADVILVIDRSATMADGLKFSAAKSASTNFIDKLFATEPDSNYGDYAYHQVGLVAFNNNIDSESLNQTGSLIQNIINQSNGILGEDLPLAYPNGYRNTSIAIGIAKNKLDPDLSFVNPCATKTMIVLTDGPPHYDLDLAKAHAYDAKFNKGIRIVSVGLKLDEIVDPAKRTEAEDFIKYISSTPSDCYYVSDLENTLENCILIPAADLETALEEVYNNITTAVCDESAPSVEIYRTPQNTLYNIDNLTIKSVATDDVGFESHLLRWSANWANPDDIIEIICGDLSGTVIECSTEELGPFSIGDIISYRSVVRDTNNNETSISLPDPRSVTVANASLNVPALFRNVNNEISITISDPNGRANLDSFSITVDAPILAGVEIEKAAMSCSGTGGERVCAYNFNPGCDWTDGISDGEANNIYVNIYIYAQSNDIGARQIASSENQLLVSYFEGNSWGNCSDEINNDCDYDGFGNPVIDAEEISCDSDSPVIGISRVPDGDVYDDDPVTFTSSATDSNGIRQHIIFYREDSGDWQIAFECNDLNADSLCDEDASQNIGSISKTMELLSPGSVIEYYSWAVDYSVNNNEENTATESFIVINRECGGVADLGPCNDTPGGKCCGGVCNAEISNPNAYSSNCVKEVCGDELIYEEDVWVSGKYGNAIKFDGTDDYVDCGNDASLQITGDQTYEFWIYPYDFTARRNPINKAYGGEGTITLEIYGKFSYYWGTGGGDTSPYQSHGSSAISANQWTHVAHVRDLTNGIMTWYLNGVANNPLTPSYAAAIASGNNLWIGDGYVNSVNGLIDEVRIYDRALSAGEVQEHYAGTFNNNTGLAGYWNLNEESGTVAHNSLGGGSDGTLTNFSSSTVKSGTLWQWDIDDAKNGVACNNDGGYSDGCYSYLPGGYFGDGGCEERAYICSSGYCNYGIANRKSDYCTGGGSSGLELNDYECVGNFCALSPNPAEENSICLPNRLFIYAEDDSNNLICGYSGAASGEIFDSDVISLFASASDTDGIDEYKIFWEIVGGDSYNYDCGSCALGEICDCNHNIGSFNSGDVVNFYVWIKNSSGAEFISDTYSFTVRNSGCYEIPGGNKPDLTPCGELDSGRCCGGICDDAPSANIYDDECSEYTCSGISWTYEPANDDAVCGVGDTCFDYYTGCVDGNKCISGFCSPDPDGILVDFCSGNLFTDYECFVGSCEIINSDLDCSADSNNDSDGVACDCDCANYDLEEKVYSSLSFDGVDDYVEVENSASLDVTDAVTIEAWVKLTSDLNCNSSNNWRSFLRKTSSTAGTSTGYDIVLEQGRKFTWDIGSEDKIRYYGSGAALPIGEWIFVTFMYDSLTSQAKIYFNGEEISGSYWDAGGGSIQSNTQSLYINKPSVSCSAGSGNFPGLIDEVRIYNRALLLEEVEDHYNGIFADDTDLVGHWDFDGNADDSSENNNHGSLNNFSEDLEGEIYGNSNWVDGIYGSGIEFDGTSDYVDGGNDSSLNFGSQSVSLEFWIYSPIEWGDQKSWSSPVGKIHQTATRKGFGFWNFGTGSKYMHFMLFESTGSDTWSGLSVSTGDLEKDLWYHIIGSYDYDSGIQEVYVDGVLANSNNIGQFDWTAAVEKSFKIGARSDNPWSGFNGSIDEVRIYNRALSGTEAQNHYNGIFADDDSLVRHWSFNEGSGTIARSISESGSPWMKYHYESVSGDNGTVPINWQVCAKTDVKDNNCDGDINDYDEEGTGNGASNCDGEVDQVVAVASAVNRDNFEVVDLFDSNNSVVAYDVDIGRTDSNFTIGAIVTDDFLIQQTIIEWTTDNWLYSSEKVFSDEGVCEVCIEGGACGSENDLILFSSLSAGNVFSFRVCSWDDSVNNNKKCTDYYNIAILSSNLTPEITPLSVYEPNFCAGLSYTLKWEFSDPDDAQASYEIQVEEGDSNFTDANKLIIDAEKYLSEDSYLIPDFTSSDFINGKSMEYKETYNWRVRVTDDRGGGYEQTTNWKEGLSFTTPDHEYPQVDFSAISYNLEECLYEIGYSGVGDRCEFGENITFSDNSNFIECTDSDIERCSVASAAKCDVVNNICVPCENSDECAKFDSSSVSYSCNTESGICEASGSCVTDDDCRVADAAKCDTEFGSCISCDDDLQCTNDKFETIGIDYFCNGDGKCEDREHRKWYFYNDINIDSVDSNPVNNYIESVVDSYIVILEIKDILGNSCYKKKNIFLGGKKYPKWNEMPPSGD